MGISNILLYCVLYLCYFKAFSAVKFVQSRSYVVQSNYLEPKGGSDTEKSAQDYMVTERSLDDLGKSSVDEMPIEVIIQGVKTTGDQSCRNGVQTKIDGRYSIECYQKAEKICVEACLLAFKMCQKLDLCVNTKFTTSGISGYRYTPDEVAEGFCKKNCRKVYDPVESLAFTYTQSIGKGKNVRGNSWSNSYRPLKQAVKGKARLSNKARDSKGIHLGWHDLPFKGYKETLKCKYKSTDKSCSFKKHLRYQAHNKNYDISNLITTNDSDIAKQTDVDQSDRGIISRSGRLRRPILNSDDSFATTSLSIEPSRCEKQRLIGKICPFETKTEKKSKRPSNKKDDSDLIISIDWGNIEQQEDNQFAIDKSYNKKKRRKCPFNKKGKDCSSNEKFKVNNDPFDQNSDSDSIISIPNDWGNLEQKNDNQFAIDKSYNKKKRRKCPFNKKGKDCSSNEKFKGNNDPFDQNSDSDSIISIPNDWGNLEQKDDNQFVIDKSYNKKKRRKCPFNKKGKNCSSKKKFDPFDQNSDSDSIISIPKDWGNIEQKDDSKFVIDKSYNKKKRRKCPFNKKGKDCSSNEKFKGNNDPFDQNSDSDPTISIPNDWGNLEQKDDNQFAIDKSYNKKKRRKCPFNKKGKDCSSNEKFKGNNDPFDQNSDSDSIISIPNDWGNLEQKDDNQFRGCPLDTNRDSDSIISISIKGWDYANRYSIKKGKCPFNKNSKRGCSSQG